MSNYHAFDSANEGASQNSNTSSEKATFGTTSSTTQGNTQNGQSAPSSAPSSAPRPTYDPKAYQSIPPYTRTDFQMPPAPKPAYRGLDTLFAWLSVLVGFLFVRAMPVTRNTLGGTLFVILLFAFGGIYLHLSKIRFTTPIIVFAICGMLLSAGMITGGNNILRGLLFLFLMVAFLYWIYASAGLSGGALLGDHCFRHAFNAIFSIPLCSILHIFPALPPRFAKNRSSGKILRTVGWCALGLAVAVIPTAIIVALLSYDAQFTALLDKIFSFSPEGVREYVRDLLLGFLVAILLFGALFGVKWERQKNNGEPEKVGSTNFHVLPRALLCAAVTPVLVVYVIFFISQWNYYISAFTSTLPQDLTYATYAREGFFELCWVCAINAVLLLLFNLLIRTANGRKDILRVIYSVVISLFTLVLIVTALSKMSLYINSYGLTQKRVYASWLMLLLAAVFILVLVRQLVPRMKLIRAALICCIAFFALIALPDVDGMIATYNVDAYLSGDLNEVDVESLEHYGACAVPAMVRLENALLEKTDRTEEETAILKRNAAALHQITDNLAQKENTVFTFNIPDARARKLLKDRPDLK